MEELGQVVSTHRGRIAGGGVVWYSAGLIMLAGVYTVLKGLVGADLGVATRGLGGVAFAALPLLWAYSLYAQTLTLHEHGFVWKRFARAPVTVRFQEIRDVLVERIRRRKTLHMKGEHVDVKLVLASGGSVTLTNDLEGIDDVYTYANARRLS